MITVRRAKDRGLSEAGWLHSAHTFSFADYYDPAHVGFRTLRVINDDRVEPAKGFGTHSHRDMEILSYVLEGTLEHKDSLGTGSLIRPGDVQRMSAGTGVLHSEFNPSRTEPVHFLQIWLLPSVRGIAPSYEQKTFGPDEKMGRLRAIASPDARDGSIRIHTDARVYAGVFGPGERASYALEPGRHAWIHVARGKLRVAGRDLEEGDGVAASDEPSITLEGTAEAGEVLLFDLP